MNDTTFQRNGKVAYVPVVINAKQKTQTNADRIISNVESLAKFIAEIADCGECEEIHGFRMCDAAASKACEDCWLGWLRQEVDNG